MTERSTGWNQIEQGLGRFSSTKADCSLHFPRCNAILVLLDPLSKGSRMGVVVPSCTELWL